MLTQVATDHRKDRRAGDIAEDGDSGASEMVSVPKALQGPRCTSGNMFDILDRKFSSEFDAEGKRTCLHRAC